MKKLFEMVDELNWGLSMGHDLADDKTTYTAAVALPPVKDGFETDDELRARVRYVTGASALPGGAKLDEIAARFGLKRRQPDGREAMKKAYYEIWGTP